MNSPSQQNSILDATNWGLGLLLGSVGTTVAILSVSVLGFLLLRGRVPFARGFVTILGCFILFGAPVIAEGLLAFAGATDAIEEGPPPVPAPSYTPTTPSPNVYDPYAGAALPSGGIRTENSLPFQ